MPTPDAALPDLEQCAAEPIHVPGAIQPHGVLLALRGPKLTIGQASATSLALLGVAAADLLGRELGAALGEPLAEQVRSARLRWQRIPDAPAAFEWRAHEEGRAFAGHVHESGEAVVLELEPVAAGGPVREDAFSRAAYAVRSVGAHRHMPDRLRTAAECVRELTGYDRVMIYRFHADWHGEVVAEARRADLEPFLHLHYPASDIPPQALLLYLVSPTRVIADVDYAPSPLLPGLDPATGKPLDLSRSVLRSVSPVHLEYLRNMGVRATLVASLVVDGKLWGLIACHHLTPRPLADDTRSLADRVARDLSAQIAIAEHAESRLFAARIQIHRENIVRAVRAGARLPALIQGPALPDFLAALAADGVALVHGEEVAAGGQTPTTGQIREIAARLQTRGATQTVGLFATDCLSAHLPELADAAPTAAGVGVFPLLIEQPMKLLWFRGEQLREVRWGGNPDKSVQVGPDGRVSPRRSFAAWTEQAKLRSVSWRPEELESARELGALIEIELRRSAEDALRAALAAREQAAAAILVAVERERRRYQSLMAIARDGIHLLDERGTLVEANEAFLGMLGLTPAAIGKLNVRDWDALVTDEEMPDRLRERFERPERFQTRHRRADGSLLDVEIQSCGIVLEGRNFVLASSRDISARRETERLLAAKAAQLEELNRSLEGRVGQAVERLRAKDQLLAVQSRQAAMGEMLGNIAHQWRQPLGALGLVLSNLRDDFRYGELDAAAIEKAVEDGNRLIQKMSSTINDFRDFVRPEQRKVSFSALQQARMALGLLEASLRHDGIEVELEAGTDFAVLGVANEYSQVLLNLLSNARQAIQGARSAGGHLHLRLEERDGLGCLSIQDDGGGIPESIRDRIFEPYFTTKPGGTGIGLYMSRQIVERRFGGRLEARNVGGGAEFAVLTPRAADPDVEPAAGDGPAPASS